MGTEIERKWLVEEVPNGEFISAKRIVQGYVISNKNESVRIRCSTDEFNPNREYEYKMTIKSGSGLVRQETEFDITSDQYDILWKLTEGKRIFKTRYVFDIENGLKAEFDIFKDSIITPLRMVEVEFPDEETANNFQPLDWFGEEVTENPFYINANLAR